MKVVPGDLLQEEEPDVSQGVEERVVGVDEREEREAEAARQQQQGGVAGHAGKDESAPNAVRDEAVVPAHKMTGESSRASEEGVLRARARTYEGSNLRLTTLTSKSYVAEAATKPAESAETASPPTAWRLTPPPWYASSRAKVCRTAPYR